MLLARQWRFRRLSVQRSDVLIAVAVDAAIPDNRALKG